MIVPILIVVVIICWVTFSRLEKKFNDLSAEFKKLKGGRAL